MFASFTISFVTRGIASVTASMYQSFPALLKYRKTGFQSVEVLVSGGLASATLPTTNKAGERWTHVILLEEPRVVGPRLLARAARLFLAVLQLRLLRVDRGLLQGARGELHLG